VGRKRPHCQGMAAEGLIAFFEELRTRLAALNRIYSQDSRVGARRTAASHGIPGATRAR
jgi:hypothetical protein